jgi:hypothetical protein
VGSGAIKIRKISNRNWTIFIPKHLVNKDGGYSLTIGGSRTPTPNILDPIIIFFVIDRNNDLINIDAQSYEANNCYRDFNLRQQLKTQITRDQNAKYFLPNDNEWYKAAYYDGGDSTYNKYATRTNKQPLCPAINEDGNGSFTRDASCDCPEIKICDVELIESTEDYYRFSLDMSKNPNDCCALEYKIFSSSNDDIWTPTNPELINCQLDPYYQFNCIDIIP